MICCLEFAWDLARICYAFVWISPGWNVYGRCFLFACDLLVICLECTWSLLGVYLNFTWDVPGVCLEFASHLIAICKGFK